MNSFANSGLLMGMMTGIAFAFSRPRTKPFGALLPCYLGDDFLQYQ